jgi:hypothetical protein
MMGMQTLKMKAGFIQLPDVHQEGFSMGHGISWVQSTLSQW